MHVFFNSSIILGKKNRIWLPLSHLQEHKHNHSFIMLFTVIQLDSLGYPTEA